MGMNEVLGMMIACNTELDVIDRTTTESIQELAEAFAKVAEMLEPCECSSWFAEWSRASEELADFKNQELSKLREDTTHRIQYLNAFLREQA